MRYESLRNFQIPKIGQAYRPRDAILYALSVGAGEMEGSGRNLDFLLESRGPRVLPSYCVDLGHPGFWLADPATTVDSTHNLHAEEGFTLLAPLPAAAEVRAETRIVDIVDKGRDKGALLYLEKKIRDAESGVLLAVVNRTLMLRGDGGYDGPSGAPRPAPVEPSMPPDLTRTFRTRRDQALLYRLNGDPNPLHLEPEAAQRAGFPRPILHGLCTFGIAATAALLDLADGDVSRLRGFNARFSAPVFPGDTLKIEMWRSGEVRVLCEESGRVVLSHGRAQILDPAAI
jgi:acyl dehydratase